MNNRDKANDNKHQGGFPHLHQLHLMATSQDNLEENLPTPMKKNNLFKEITTRTLEDLTKNFKQDSSAITDPLNKTTETQEIDLPKET